MFYKILKVYEDNYRYIYTYNKAIKLINPQKASLTIDNLHGEREFPT